MYASEIPCTARFVRVRYFTEIYFDFLTSKPNYRAVNPETGLTPIFKTFSCSLSLSLLRVITHLTLVDPRVPGDDVLDLEDPVVLLLLLHQLEPRVRRERLNAVRQDVPVLPPDPRELFPGKKEREKK